MYIYIICVYKYNMCIHTLVFQFPNYLEPGVYLPDKNIHVYIKIYIYIYKYICVWTVYIIKYALYKSTTPIGWLWDLQLQLWMPCHVDLPNVGLGLSSNSTVFACGVGSHMWLSWFPVCVETWKISLKALQHIYIYRCKATHHILSAGSWLYVLFT